MSDFDRLAKRLENLADDLEDNVEEQVDDDLKEVRRRARIRLSANGTNWTGVLSSSIVVENGSLVVEGPHGAFVELGTGAHFDAAGMADKPTPFDAPSFSETLVDNIRNWVETKPVYPRNPNYTQDELPFVIAKNISYEGTSSQPFLRPSWFSHVETLKANVRRTVRRTASRV